jgi:hypothetical protein
MYLDQFIEVVVHGYTNMHLQESAQNTNVIYVNQIKIETKI